MVGHTLIISRETCYNFVRIYMYIILNAYPIVIERKIKEYVGELWLYCN